jgi:hypothetical protein
MIDAERISALEKRVAELEAGPGRPEQVVHGPFPPSGFFYREESHVTRKDAEEHLACHIDAVKICDELLDVLIKHKLSIYWLDHILDVLGRMARERSPIRNIKFR